METVRNLALISLAAAFVGFMAQRPVDVRYDEVGHKIRIIGRYGHPLGTYLELDGRRHGNSKGPTKTGGGNFIVERVNGKAVADATDIYVPQLAAEKDGTRCRVEGYETGEMIGVPDAVLKRTGGPGPQAAWQFYVRLEVLKAAPLPLDR
jgi:hypothetical protein